MAKPTTTELLGEFRAYLKRKGRSPHTMKVYKNTVLRLDRHLGRRHLLTASTDDLRDWVDTLNVGIQARASYINGLATFYAWVKGRGYRPDNPVSDLERPKVPKRVPRPIDDAVLNDAWERVAIGPADEGNLERLNRLRLKAILALQAYEGFRDVEVSRLLGQDVNRAFMSILARGKGNVERVVPLHPIALAALEEYGLPARGPVFKRLHGGRILEGRIRSKWVDEPISAANVLKLVTEHLPAGWTPHMLRHWFGTSFYRDSKDLLLLQGIMGHEDPGTTAGYAKADASSAAGTVGRLQIGGGADQVHCCSSCGTTNLGPSSPVCERCLEGGAAMPA